MCTFLQLIFTTLQSLSVGSKFMGKKIFLQTLVWISINLHKDERIWRTVMVPSSKKKTLWCAGTRAGKKVPAVLICFFPGWQCIQSNKIQSNALMYIFCLCCWHSFLSHKTSVAVIFYWVTEVKNLCCSILYRALQTSKMVEDTSL